MGYPSIPPASGRPSPPATVKVATYLLWITAAVALITGLLTLSVVGKMSAAYRDVYQGTPAEGTEAVLVGAGVVGAIISVLFAVGLAVLAVFNNRGRNGARITTWVIGGVSLCCTGLGLAGTAVTNSMNLGDTAGGPSSAEVERRLNEALPSWYDPATLTLSAISLLAILTAMILLALPASNAYFRRPAAVWDPSQPYPYPGGQPPYPTYPTPGGQPGYPPYPGQGYPQPPGPPSPGTPPSGGPSPSPSGETGAGPSAPGSPGPAGGQPPHTGSIPPTDPWGRPDDDQRPPSGPAA